MAKNVIVDASECIGCELCVDTCPEVFSMNDEGVSEIVNPAGAPKEKIQEVIDNCPVECIHWEE